MNDFFARFRFQLNQFLSGLTPQQKVLLTLVGVGILSILIIFFVWTSSTPYEPLFTDLSPKDAAEIVEKLKGMNIKYKLQDGGRSIMVPTNRVYELRLEFAKDGLPETGSVGYEIFDKQELGVTEFRQQIAYKRALEGELARTIRSIDVVDRASVFIVIPRERLFTQDQKAPTASVQLKLKRSSPPPPMTIEAIANLVASSVEGLEPENVTITDTRGRILSQNRNPASTLALSSTQLEFAQKIEKDLAEKAQKVLEMRVGPGNAIVQVTAELNWAQVEKTIREVDPDKSAPVSEETLEESNPLENSAASSKSSNTITNYENSSTIQKIVEEVGNIEHLSVAVLVNNRKEVYTDKDGEEKVRYVPRDPEEIRQLETLVKTAVGFREDRNDQFSIVNMEFSPDNWEDDVVKPDTPLGDYPDVLQKLLIVLVIIGAIFLMRSILTQVRTKSEELQAQIKSLEQTRMPAKTYSELGEEEEIPALEEPENEAGAEPEEEQESATMIKPTQFFRPRISNQINDKVNEYVRENPEVASKLLRVWLLEEEEEEV